MKRNRRQLLIATAALAACPRLRAQGNAPMRLWVGTPPCGSTGTIARELASELARLLGRTVIVENKSGAGGNLAADAVARSALDGGPARMAPELVQRISDAARTAMKSETIRKRLEQDAAEVVASSPQEFARFVEADIARWAPLVRRSGATPES
nr:tripartite tricarboxylate transporter substrate-binding protein [Caldimonas sp.]